ncbi:MAG: L,D-transpeptidase [Pseudonocardia sp.]
MGAHRGLSRTGRPLAGRLIPAAAAVAVLAAVAGSLLVGVGAADEGLDLARALPVTSAPAPALLPAPVAPAPALLPAPVAEPSRQAAEAPATATPADELTADESTADESTADESTADEPTADESTVDEPPVKVPAKAPAAATGAPAGGGPGAPVSGTPCTASARACVDLTEQTAWLIENGEIKRGPIGVMIGSEEEPTPVGKFTVEWKAREYTSRELLVEMPYAIFFAPGGIAFHEGRQDTYSAGCVKLTNADAAAWFDFLQVGDEVQVVHPAVG